MARNGRRNAGQQRRSGAVVQLPWRDVTNPYPPLEILDADQLEAIHDASMEILENLGIEFLGDDALDLQALADRKRAGLGGEHTPMRLGDFFFSQDDPLLTDYDEEDDDGD